MLEEYEFKKNSLETLMIPQVAQKITTRLFQPIEGVGKIRTLYPEGELLLPINKLVVSKEFQCSLNEILKICTQIKDHVYLPPITVTESNLIVEGNERYYAYLRLGYQKVSVIRNRKFVDVFGGNEFSILDIHN